MHKLHLLLFLSSLIGSAIFYLIGAPMPFLLGSILGSASFVLTYETPKRQLPELTRWVRLVFIALIGAMIGSRFSPELLGIIPQFWATAAAIIPFILVAHAGNYWVMRHLGGYKKLDAYFAALPGGIVDSIALAEQMGADVRIVTAQHFIRIILVVVTVPLLFLFVTGDAVGSLAGETLGRGTPDYVDLGLIAAIAMAGLFLGRHLKLPVSHMMGPMLLALILSVTGVIAIDTPAWLLNLAQFMVGTSLGAQFSGISRKLLLKGLGMGVISGIFMLLLALFLAIVLSPFVPVEFPAVFISFAAGGLTEMSLIALSLNLNPVVVALHHLARIFLTVWIGAFLVKRVLDLKQNP
ncbi:MAG: AbrB family transcriptional regulator [Pseudomonadota bacterium]